MTRFYIVVVVVVVSSLASKMAKPIARYYFIDILAWLCFVFIFILYLILNALPFVIHTSVVIRRTQPTSQPNAESGNETQIVHSIYLLSNHSKLFFSLSLALTLCVIVSLLHNSNDDCRCAPYSIVKFFVVECRLFCLDSI